MSMIMRGEALGGALRVEGQQSSLQTNAMRAIIATANAAAPAMMTGEPKLRPANTYAPAAGATD